MNYIKELNSMYDYCISNLMPTSEIVLLFALYQINNSRSKNDDWIEWFEADNILVARLTGLSRQTINVARNKLRQRERIDFREGVKNKRAPKYKIIPFGNNGFDIQPDIKKGNSNKSDIQVDIQPDIQVDIQPDIQLDILPDHLYKHKQETKTKTETLKKTKEKKGFSFDEQINKYTKNNDLAKTIHEFIKYREEMKHPLTKLALTKILNQLDKWGYDDCQKIDCLDRSIMNNWRGVFELKTVYSDNKPENIDEFASCRGVEL